MFKIVILHFYQMHNDENANVDNSVQGFNVSTCKTFVKHKDDKTFACTFYRKYMSLKKCITVLKASIKL